MLFNLTYITYALATTLYLVFFSSQNKKVRPVARRILLLAGISHTLTLSAATWPPVIRR